MNTQDADHHMEPDFLRRAMPHFFDKDGKEELRDIGLVQASWGYYNMNQNFLTEAGKVDPHMSWVDQALL